METKPGSELDLEAFVLDIESDASQQVYAQRYIHPPVAIAGPHSYDPEPMDPKELPELEDELKSTGDAWED